MGTLEGNGLIFIEQNAVEKLVNLFRHMKLTQKKFFSEL